MELVIRRVRLEDREGPSDIGILGGRIARIADTIEVAGTTQLDAEGRLASPAFVDPSSSCTGRNGLQPRSRSPLVPAA